MQQLLNNLSSGLKTSTSIESIIGITEKKVNIVEEVVLSEDHWKNNVSLNAGYPLLSRYERLWSIMHENNIDLCREAERTDRQLHNVINNANGQFKSLREFEKEILNLPNLCEKLNKTINFVEEINRRFTVLENLYSKLAEKKICDSVQSWKKRITDEALAHEENRKQELLKLEYKLRMEKEKADRDEEIHKKLLELEIKRKKEFEQRKIAQEQQKINKAFEDAFHQELHNYKSSQAVPQATKQETTLEQFDLDNQDEKPDLMSFLTPDERRQKEAKEKENNSNNNNSDNIENDNNVIGEDLIIEGDNSDDKNDKKDLVYSDDEKDDEQKIAVIPIIEDADADYTDQLAIDVKNLTTK